MVIRRRDPLRDLLLLQERMNRVFELSLSRGRPDDPMLASGSWVPLADVYETGEAFVLQVELPGLSQDDIEVQVEGDELILKGERRMSAAARPESFHRMERSYGPFSRSFRFSEEIDPDRVTAQFRDGVLRLDLPKIRPRGTAWVRVERSQ